MFKRALVGFLAAATLSACGVHTRAAVKNDTDAPISVELISAIEKESARFDNIAPGTTSTYQQLDFDNYGEMQVKIGERVERVDLKPEHDNTLVITPDAVKVDHDYNPENEWW